MLGKGVAWEGVMLTGIAVSPSGPTSACLRLAPRHSQSHGKVSLCCAQDIHITLASHLVFS